MNAKVDAQTARNDEVERDRTVAELDQNGLEITMVRNY